MPRRSRIVLLALAAIVLTGLVVVAPALWAIDIAPGLAFITSLALLGVTWIYVGHTRVLVEVQREQIQALRDQLKASLRQSHFSAVSKLWSISLEAQDALNEARLWVPEPFLPGVSLAKRELAVEKLREIYPEVNRCANAQLSIVVDVDGPLEMETLHSISSLLGVVADIQGAVLLAIKEINEAKSGSKPFDLSAVVAGWESPKDPEKAHLVRWADFVSAGSIDDVRKELSRLGESCRREMRSRSV